ncbi:hypothetical protein, partial [Kitasatospora albolonga]|uniref:hypothetical protein n=1 Tax=Kitasatospora albolonga TaxID=68173 RepID=UPI0031E86302
MIRTAAPGRGAAPPLQPAGSDQLRGRTVSAGEAEAAADSVGEAEADGLSEAPGEAPCECEASVGGGGFGRRGGVRTLPL